MASEERDGTRYHTMRDLRNGSVVKNVTRTSARKLWHYAISAKEAGSVNPNTVIWNGSIGLWRKTHKGGQTRFDLVQRTDEGLRVYYGVTEDGIHGPWRKLVEADERLAAPTAPAAPGAEPAPEPAGLSAAGDIAAIEPEPAPGAPMAAEAPFAQPAETVDLPAPGGAEDAGAPLIDLEVVAANGEAEHPAVDAAVVPPAQPAAETNGSAEPPARKSRGRRGSGSSKKAAKAAGKTAAKAARKQPAGAAKKASRPRARKPKGESGEAQ
jgi:hypothetical protein